MLPSSYPTQTCSIARALEVVGERWTLLVLREALFGKNRFDEFREALGIAPNVLTIRLERLTEEGLLKRVRYRERPERFAYHLTPKGQELAPILLLLMKWGDRHYPEPDGPPVITKHRDCGGNVDASLRCDTCGAQVSVAELAIVPGPGRAKSTGKPASPATAR
jgi:DNA-binding HxlR family transcriptional regulator